MLANDTLQSRALFKFLKQLVLTVPAPFWRHYIRYAPSITGKLWLLERVIDPFYQRHPCKFVASTMFGSRISGNTVEMLSKFIFFYGVWEPTMTSFIRNRLVLGDSFIDVGANIGYYTVLASKLVGPTGSVVAIEPSPSIFETLEENLRLNKAANVRAMCVAVSDHREMLRLYKGPPSNPGLTTTHVKIEHLTKSQIQSIEKAMGPVSSLCFETEVEALPLGDIVSLEEIKRARVIKIDCEGAEWAIASGMRSLLTSVRPDLEIIIEIVPEYLALQGKTPENVLNIFLIAGFHAYQLEGEYDPGCYVNRRPMKRLTRIRTPIRDETNIILSRKNVEELSI